MGVKRKLEDLETLENEAFGGQRQSILNISMFKLQSHPPRRVEPSLLRSVLILNTLKHIECELQKEGVVCGDLSETASLTLNDNSDVSMDILPEMETGELYDEELSHSNNEHYSNIHLGSKKSGSALPPIETFVELSAAGNTIVSKELTTKVTHISESETKDLTPLSLLPVKTDDILADIDISHCDFDIFSSLASSMKLTPLSAEEVIHSFPVHHAAGVISADSYTSLLTSPINSSCKGDILPEEIDNIMQILVGT